MSGSGAGAARLAGTPGGVATGITRLDPATDPRWDEFVADHPRGSLWHSAAWARITQRVYGYRPEHLAYQVDGEIKGLLPLVRVSSRLTGDRLVSLPFSGPVGPLGATPEIVTALCEAAADRREELGSDYISVNSTADLCLRPPRRLEQTQPFVCSILSLDSGPAAIWRTRLRERLRTDIRRAQRLGVAVSLAERSADLDPFYALYLQTSRRHGMPPQPRALFRAIWQEFAAMGRLELLQACLGERLVAAQLCLGFKDVYSVIYVGIDYRYLDYGPVKLLDWFAIERACAQGYLSFDLLQSHVKNAGLRWYKRGFGCVELPVNYYFYPRVGSTSGMRELLVGGRSPLSNVLRALLRRIPAAEFELLGRLAFRHVG